VADALPLVACSDPGVHVHTSAEAGAVVDAISTGTPPKLTFPTSEPPAFPNAKLGSVFVFVDVKAKVAPDGACDPKVNLLEPLSVLAALLLADSLQPNVIGAERAPHRVAAGDARLSCDFPKLKPLEPPPEVPAVVWRLSFGSAALPGLAHVHAAHVSLSWLFMMAHVGHFHAP
jgi:hypothetical protein